MQLSDPITAAPLVGEKYKTLFAKLGIKNIHDLLDHYPARYIDYRNLANIADLPMDEEVTVQGEVLRIVNQRTKYGKTVTRAYIGDATGKLEAIWFNQPFIVNTVKQGAAINLSGKLSGNSMLPQMKSPEYEVVSAEESIHTARLVPVYPETKGISSKRLRAIISRILRLIPTSGIDIVDFMPDSVKEENSLIDLSAAFKQIHFPENNEEIKKARERLSFDELFLMQLKSFVKKKEWGEKGVAKALSTSGVDRGKFSDNLPFKLTSAQDRVIEEMMTDLSKTTPMNRLLEGDVGSGKTVVAATGMYSCIDTGLKSILMAPTEILAEQHFKNISEYYKGSGANIDLHTGSTKTNSKCPNIIIGTHALLYDTVTFGDVGLIIIDEQHRFGVNQRAKLIEKATSATVPHVLSMTATPIPRTMALTVYGDLDISILDEMPPGRIPVKTHVVPPIKREVGEQWIREQIAQNNAQVFIICPLIEESDNLQVKAATQEYQRLTKTVFVNEEVALLHGQMKSKEKQSIISKFAEGAVDVLVSTSVVEVGIDITNASIMVIEGAERFGLAQLHQLRGRVGRSDRQSYCFLFTESKSPASIKRLKAMEKSNDGFELAELDLKTRGPGEIYGLKQSGLPQLKIATLSDAKLIEKTRKAAQKIVKDGLDQHPDLENILQSEKIAAN